MEADSLSGFKGTFHRNLSLYPSLLGGRVLRVPNAEAHWNWGGPGAVGDERCPLALAQGGWATLALNDQRTGSLCAPPLHTTLLIMRCNPQGESLTFKLPSSLGFSGPLRSLSHDQGFSE
jgi:hypothetical protein